MPENHIEKIQRQFERQFEAYASLPDVSEEKTLGFIVRVSKAVASDAVLDVASGPGFIAMAFAEKCREVVGVDVTEPFLAGARRLAESKGLDNLRFEHQNVESMNFSDGHFDIAVCRSAFHHFPDPGKVLTEMKRVVKPGGRLLILDMVASEDPDKAEYHHRLEMLCDPTHAKALAPSEFETLFRDCNLSVEYERDGNVCYPVEQWIAHGGPSDEDAAKIIELMKACFDEDLAGIPIYLLDDELTMEHVGKTYLLKKEVA